jgi:hypothetical protein
MRFHKSKKKLNPKRTSRQLMGCPTSTNLQLISLQFLLLETRITKWKMMRLRTKMRIKTTLILPSSFNRTRVLIKTLRMELINQLALT